MRDLDLLATAYGKLFLRMHRLLDRRMAQGGASLARTKLLMCVDKEGPIRATDIAELFGLAPRTVTEALDGLERAALVVRTPDPQDRRVKQIAITQEGRDAIRATEPLRIDLVERVFGKLSAEQCEQLDGIIGVLTEAVDANEDSGVRKIGR